MEGRYEGMKKTDTKGLSECQMETDYYKNFPIYLHMHVDKRSLRELPYCNMLSSQIKALFSGMGFLSFRFWLEWILILPFKYYC